MTMQIAPAITQEEELYRLRTPRSLRRFVEAAEYLPGGDSRSPLFYAPYPAVMERGEGCWVVDVDGNRLLDLTSNHSSLVHGYGHPHVRAAVERQLAKGTIFPGPTDPQIEYARHLCQRLASVERIRFANSGTEAAMNAVRAARAFTGRHAIAKAEGGYHGTFDDALVSTHPAAADAGDAARPRAVPSSRGLPPSTLDNVVVLPFNDAAAATDLIEREHERLAGVIVEPVMGSAGMIPAERDYLAALRDVTARYGIVLIFDEVVSLRVAYGGAEEHYGVKPDLTVLGKLVGGGYPLGAFGGRADIMAMFDPSRGRPQIPHPGSHNANPIGMVAGLATLELLTRDVVERLNARGEALRARLRAAFQERGLEAQITGLGSLFAIHLTSQPVAHYRDTLSADPELRRRLFLGLFNEGVLIDPRGVGNVSTVIGDAEIDRFIAALGAVLDRMAEA